MENVHLFWLIFSLSRFSQVYVWNPVAFILDLLVGRRHKSLWALAPLFCTELLVSSWVPEICNSVTDLYFHEDRNAADQRAAYLEDQGVGWHVLWILIIHFVRIAHCQIMYKSDQISAPFCSASPMTNTQETGRNTQLAYLQRNIFLPQK